MVSVESSHPDSPGVLASLRQFWHECARRSGKSAATREVMLALWEFLRESTPSRLRLRFGDADYDWDYRVNTTSGAVGWHDRLLGQFHSAYQPTEPSSFREMLHVLQEIAHIDLAQFAFVDFGSGKGRTLLMASNYPFRRIIGVELLPNLNEIATQNLAAYKSDSQQCFSLESVCADATTYPLPSGPLLIYLFNPLPEWGLRKVLENLSRSWRQDPRPLYVLYHNPVLEHVLGEAAFLNKIGLRDQYSMYRAG